MTKIGVNDPCPCGATKTNGAPLKYKKCCMPKQSQPVPPEVIEKAIDTFKKQQAEQKLLYENGIFVNYVKPVTFINPNTGKPMKIWAIGNRICYGRPEHETFPEFIIDYLQKEIMGKDWWEAQLQSQQKHFLFQCFIKWEEWRKRNANEENRIDDYTWKAPTDGWARTLVSLAFDICSLEHTQQLPEHLIKRLKNRGEYQGAHYEIAIAAIFGRLGCGIDFLDTKKVATAHCEFIATHKETGASIAVEAKSRHRSGIKHMFGKFIKELALRGDVKRLFRDALKQNPKNGPFAIFIDVNAPLTPTIPIPEKPWIKDIKRMLDGYPAASNNPDEYTFLFFTNFSPHYDGADKSSPNEYLAVIPLFTAYPMESPIFGERLLKAVQNYGFIPDVEEKEKI